MRHGSPVTSGFVVGDELSVEEELRKWRKLELPKSQDPVGLAAELGNEKIGVHFDWDEEK